MENNYSGQLEEHIVKSLELRNILSLAIANFRKYTLYPFYREDLDIRLGK